MDEERTPTAWEEINPPMALVPRAALPSQYSARLEPASRDEFRNELTACLALVVPVGMPEQARKEWLLVAWQTLRHLPADLLAAGCQKARETCDHHSKIVPTILSTIDQSMRWRREAARDELPPAALPAPRYCTPEEARAILKEFGLASNPVAPEGEE